MNGYLGLSLLFIAAAGIGLSLRWLWRAYVRAHYMQALWGKRIDALTLADWQATARHLTDDEFDHLMKVANMHSVNRNSDVLAPTLRDVVVQFHIRNNEG